MILDQCVIILTSTEWLSMMLVLILLFIGFKLLETTWSYKINKPFSWEEAVKNKTVSRRLKKFERFYRDRVRFYNFWFQIERLRKERVEGAFAEVGVYKGETARIIHEMDPSRRFYLFDTFEGFAERDLQFENQKDEPWNSISFKDTSLDEVKRFIQGNENLRFLPGYFPDTAHSLGSAERFALVHLDADLYQPTLEGLKYFYPRLSPGGVIVVHDYHHNWEGVQKSVDEFVAGIPESLIVVPDWQGSVMIVKNR